MEIKENIELFKNESLSNVGKVVVKVGWIGKMDSNFI